MLKQQRGWFGSASRLTTLYYIWRVAESEQVKYVVYEIQLDKLIVNNWTKSLACRNTNILQVFPQTRWVLSKSVFNYSVYIFARQMSSWCSSSSFWIVSVTATPLVEPLSVMILLQKGPTLPSKISIELIITILLTVAYTTHHFVVCCSSWLLPSALSLTFRRKLQSIILLFPQKLQTTTLTAHQGLYPAELLVILIPMSLFTVSVQPIICKSFADGEPYVIVSQWVNLVEKGSDIWKDQDRFMLPLHDVVCEHLPK